MNARTHIWPLSLAVLAALAVTGCPQVSTTKKVEKSAIQTAKEATKSDLIASYNQLASGITSLNASVDMVPTAGSTYSGLITEYHEVSAFILARRPAMIRVIGQAPLVATDVFDMTSDGETFHVYIPSKKKFIVGPASLERPAEKPIENLRPQHLLDALFWTPIPANASVLIEEDDEISARYYVLTVLRNSASQEIERKLWFDRTDLSLARIEMFGLEGRLLSDTRMDDWHPAGEGSDNSAGSAAAMLPYPRHIVLHRPHDDYKLEIRVKKLTLNQEIALDRFHLDQPPGTELVRADEAKPGSQP